MEVSYFQLLLMVTAITEDNGFTTVEELANYLEENDGKAFTFESLED